MDKSQFLKPGTEKPEEQGGPVSQARTTAVKAIMRMVAVTAKSASSGVKVERSATLPVKIAKVEKASRRG